MFDVSWKPKDYEEKVKKERSFGGYHHYSTSTHEDAKGFCEYLKYQGCTDIKIEEWIPYNSQTVAEKRRQRGVDTSEFEKRNVDLVKNCLDEECHTGNIPYTFRDLFNMVKEYNLDWDKPLLVDVYNYCALEHIYFLEKEDDCPEGLEGCIVLDMTE